MNRLLYPDRRAAARELLNDLEPYRGRPDLLVLALPRGGVPVGFEVARGLKADLDIVVVRKLGLPGQPELAMGAVAGRDVVLRNERVIAVAGVSEQVFATVEGREREEVFRREKAYRGNRPPPAIEGRCVILVDDGLATGSTMSAAIEVVRRHDPSEIVVAVPVAPPETVDRLLGEADDVICPATPRSFRGVGQFYEDFSQLDDDEVRAWLERAWGNPSAETDEW